MLKFLLQNCGHTIFGSKKRKRVQKVKDSRDKLKYDKTLVDISTTNNIDEVHSFCKLKLDRIINESRCFPDQK